MLSVNRSGPWFEMSECVAGEFASYTNVKINGQESNLSLTILRIHIFIERNFDVTVTLASS